jgi:hypothetical protein
VVSPLQNHRDKEIVMADERPEIYEEGVILEDLEIEELEEVIAPAKVLVV